MSEMTHHQPTLNAIFYLIMLKNLNYSYIVILIHLMIFK